METINPEVTVAEGPQDLKAVLANFRDKAQQDAEFRTKDHYIMYRLKDQKSLLKVDLSQQPYQFWFYDLLGRPATNAVKDTVAEFIWESASEGERERFFSGGAES